MIEARPKVGTRVSPASRWSFFDPQVLSWHFYKKPDARFYESLFEVRRSLEVRAAKLACERRTAEHVRSMKYWLHQMEMSDGALEPHGLSSLEIHRAIADSSGNALLRSVTGVVELTTALALKSQIDKPRTDYPATSLGAHARLVAGIERASVADAQDAVGAIIALDELWVEKLLG